MTNMQLAPNTCEKPVIAGVVRGADRELHVRSRSRSRSAAAAQALSVTDLEGHPGARLVPDVMAVEARPLVVETAVA